MINIIDKRNCCGCEACINACPKGCITPIIDAEGFLYPKVDLSKCIDCHICEQVCPELVPYEKIEPISSYASWIKDEELRLKSSSGGLFTAIAENIINNGGIVYGAAFNDELELSHISCDNIAELSKLRGSKYLQSRIGNTFKRVRDDLINNRLVLFSGTGCQIAGLKHYLKKDYPNLYTIEVICHGVPSPKVWKNYMTFKLGRIINDIKYFNISFRDKRYGWKWFGVNLEIETPSKKLSYYRPYPQDSYMKCFLKNLTLRPSCYNCPVKKSRSNADIIIGDFWGVAKIYHNLDDDRGCSAVIVYSEKGSKLLGKTNISIHNVKYSDILDGNHVLETSVQEPAERPRFWADYNNTRSIKTQYDILCLYGLGYKETLWYKCLSKFHELTEKGISYLQSKSKR